MDIVTRNDNLILDSRKKLSMTCVESVDGFSDKFLKLTVNGDIVFIGGNNIKITSFNKSNGTLTCDGDFCDIKYNYKKESVIKRIFK